VEKRISVNSWVTIGGDCPVVCDMVGDQAQFEFGTMTGSLNLVTDESGLVLLHRIADEALTRLRAIPEGEEVSFTVFGDHAVPA
jgi:hypothetical protein